MGLLEIDGSRFSGSGSIVRQSMAYAALTGTPIRVVNARSKRDVPGLRPQHLAAARAVCDLVGGRLEGAAVGARRFEFHPGTRRPRRDVHVDVGTAGSSTAVALAVVPVLAVRGIGARVQVRGGVFQDFAPSLFHLQHVVTPLLARMGLDVEFALVRPGYVPRGDGLVSVRIRPPTAPLTPLALSERGPLERVRGIAFASHLAERRVVARMADAAREVLLAHDIDPKIDEHEDTTAPQAGAAFSLFAACGDCLLGADRAGKRGRSSEEIGTRVATQLLEELATAATVDRHAMDQLVVFGALAAGTSVVRGPRISGHVESAAWLAEQFVGAAVALGRGGTITIHGGGVVPEVSGS